MVSEFAEFTFSARIRIVLCILMVAEMAEYAFVLWFRNLLFPDWASAQRCMTSRCGVVNLALSPFRFRDCPKFLYFPAPLATVPFIFNTSFIYRIPSTYPPPPFPQPSRHVFEYLGKRIQAWEI